VEEFNWASAAIPVITGFVGGGAIGAFLGRKSSRESNANTAMNFALSQLLSINDSLRGDVENLKRDMLEINNKYTTSESTVKALTARVDDLQDDNRMLAEQLGLLVASWPAGTAMPPISEEWRKYLR
jgi:site-specific DNA-adenine methylase